MELQQQIEQALKEAMRHRDVDRRNAVRGLLTAVKNKEKDLKRTLNDSEIQQLIVAQIKQRKDAVEQYQQAKREDLAATEQHEITILQKFLPEPLSPAELDRLLDEAIEQVGARSVKDLGKVMKVLMPKLTGRADGKQVNELARNKLHG